MDSDGTGATAGTDCNTDSDGVLRCDCNSGFQWNEDTAECEAENPLDEEPEDELASVLSDDSSIDELQSLNLPEDTDLEETTPTEADLGTDTDGESSANCSINEDGTIPTNPQAKLTKGRTWVPPGVGSSSSTSGAD